VRKEVAFAPEILQHRHLVLAMLLVLGLVWDMVQYCMLDGCGTRRWEDVAVAFACLFRRLPSFPLFNF
jgi:hypothetical protein